MHYLLTWTFRQMYHIDRNVCPYQPVGPQMRPETDKKVAIGTFDFDRTG